MPSASVLPSSRERMRPISSLRVRSSSPTRLRMSWRIWMPDRDQVGKASLGGRNSGLSLGGVGVNEAPDHVMGVGRVDVFATLGPLDPVTADVVLADLGHGAVSLLSDTPQIDSLLG